MQCVIPLTLMFSVPARKNPSLLQFIRKDPRLFANYRPVSITRVPCRLVERIISVRFITTFYTIIYFVRYGFVRGLSTCTNLLESLTVLLAAVEYFGLYLRQNVDHFACQTHRRR